MSNDGRRLLVTFLVPRIGAYATAKRLWVDRRLRIDV